MGALVSSHDRNLELEEEKVKEKAISSLQRAYVMLAPSKLEGVGVFAVRDVGESVEVLRWDWLKYQSVFVPEEELRRRVPIEVFDQLRRIWHVDERGYVATPVDFSGTLSYVNFLNHSDQPNLSFNYSDGTYVTSRAVKQGEELFINYDRDYYPGYTDGFRAREAATHGSGDRTNI